MPYDDTDLHPNDPTSLAWAVAWTRFFTGDRTEPHHHSDAELQAVLTATAFTSATTTYYRPHVAAAAIINGDATRAVSESTLGASITNRDAASVAIAIRRGGAWIDKLIEAATGTAPPSTRTLEVTW